jgi:hypothetical protein
MVRTPSWRALGACSTSCRMGKCDSMVSGARSKAGDKSAKLVPSAAFGPYFEADLS